MTKDISRASAENSMNVNPSSDETGTTVSLDIKPPTPVITRRCDPNLCLFKGICDPVTQKCKCRDPYMGKCI